MGRARHLPPGRGAAPAVSTAVEVATQRGAVEGRRCLRPQDTSLKAMVIACVRSAASSLARIEMTWVLTVPSLMDKATTIRGYAISSQSARGERVEGPDATTAVSVQDRAEWRMGAGVRAPIVTRARAAERPGTSPQVGDQDRWGGVGEPRPVSGSSDPGRRSSVRMALSATGGASRTSSAGGDRRRPPEPGRERRPMTRGRARYAHPSGPVRAVLPPLARPVEQGHGGSTAE
jgi:hypothetical protein